MTGCKTGMSSVLLRLGRFWLCGRTAKFRSWSGRGYLIVGGGSLQGRYAAIYH